MHRELLLTTKRDGNPLFVWSANIESFSVDRVKGCNCGSFLAMSLAECEHGYGSLLYLHGERGVARVRESVEIIAEQLPWFRQVYCNEYWPEVKE